MKWSIVAVCVCLVLAGCTQTPAPDDESSGPDESSTNPPPTDDPTSSENNTNDPPAPVQVTTTLVDERVTIPGNACPADSDEDLMHSLDVPVEASSLDLEFVNVNEPPTLFATNIRLYDPDSSPSTPPGATDQEAWGAEGITFQVNDPKAGTWTVYLLHCDVPESGDHVIDSFITVTAPE